MNKDLNMESMVAEYKATLAELDAYDGSSAAVKKITLALSEQHDWSHSAAFTLVNLAQDYGTFMLRNALALAEALEIEDGALGF